MHWLFTQAQGSYCSSNEQGRCSKARLERVRMRGVGGVGACEGV
jgi:hypothetical protein